LNYRHAFHAGNFADLVKHAALLQLLDHLRSDAGALNVIDTHAGRGIYDLRGAEAHRSGEAAAGIGQLVGEQQLPAPMARLREAVDGSNRGAEIHLFRAHLG
jgi:23S rRNA (adenine2030-N6)-methyltransferase